MRIRYLKSDQFAGLKDKEIAFAPNLNILLGANETGKSTIVDLLYYMFFQKTKLDRRSDKEFTRIYFPITTGEVKADFINGTISFETARGRYCLEKEWSSVSGQSILICPDGTKLKDPAEIHNLLAGELSFGKGIYDELVFASQKREQSVLNALLSGVEQKNKGQSAGTVTDEITSAVAKAVMETGGLSLDKMEAQITNMVASFEGCWDFKANRPKDWGKRGINNPWTRGVGTILKAFYDMESTRVSYENAVASEKQIETLDTQIKKVKTEKETARSELAMIYRIKDSILLRTIVGQITSEIASLAEEQKRWPDIEKELKNALRLKQIYGKTEVYDQLETIRELQQRTEELQHALFVRKVPNTSDISDMEQLSRKLFQAQTKLSVHRSESLNVVAKIKNMSYRPLTIRTLSDNRKLEEVQTSHVGKETTVEIKEAVDISIPNTLEMQLIPNEGAVGNIVEEIKKLQKRIQSYADKYEIRDADLGDVDALNKAIALLKKIKEQADATKQEITANKAKIEYLLAGKTIGELETTLKRARITPEKLEASREEIVAICGNTPLDTYIGRRQGAIDALTSKYGSRDDLKLLIQKKRQELAERKQSLANADKIPIKYKEIVDPEQYIKQLNAKIDDLDSELDDLRTAQAKAENSLSLDSAEELFVLLEEKTRAYQQVKQDYSHWKHIRDVFVEERRRIEKSPIEDIGNRFQGYLTVISGGSLRLSSVDERLVSNIISGTHPLSCDTLSEGTKETILLAFRLAVLDHLYGGNGGLAVFDDPFTDMDPKRTAEACKLIQKFADHNQVIFVTCDEKYTRLLAGNVVLV